MEITDTYKTLETASEEVLFKDRGSKFFGYAFVVHTEEDIKSILEKIKSLHKNARHCCYAYQLGTENIRYRVNDDGEPSNTAGMPIYGQIKAFEITNVIVLVIRYFGGVKLGVGGLINAYRTAAKMALEQAIIVEKTIDIAYNIEFEYALMNKVMRLIKEKQLRIVNQRLELKCCITIHIRKRNEQLVKDAFENLYQVKIKKIEP